MAEKKVTRKLCGAKVKNKNKPGQFCKQPAMANGRCRLHGGMSLSGVAHGRYKHGRYSREIPDDLRERYHRALEDPQLLSIRDDVALMEGRVKQLIERVQTKESSQTWKVARQLSRQYVEAKRNKDVAQMAELSDQLAILVYRGAPDYQVWEDIQRTVDQKARLAKQEEERMAMLDQMMTAEQAMLICFAILNIIRANVDDVKARGRISHEIGKIISANARRRTDDRRDEHEDRSDQLGEEILPALSDGPTLETAPSPGDGAAGDVGEARVP